MHDDCIREITSLRTMGSVPFGGRYRMIDFPLSNMVNSNISKVGVITKSNYQSLMDHLGSGKAWDLSRKREGLFILPPFGHGNGLYAERIDALSGISSFLKECKEEFVVMSDCHIAYNIDFSDVINYHYQKGADITIVYKNGVVPDSLPEKVCLEFGRAKRISEIINGVTDKENKCDWSMGIYVMKRDFLMKIIAEAVARNRNNFVRDVLQSAVEQYKMFGYKFDGCAMAVTSMEAYFEANMSLVNKSVREDLFNPNRPVYTKVLDEMPAKFGLGAIVTNSIVADGCVIEGEVSNCILFRGVKIGKGAKVSNCIIMQDTQIGDNAILNYVITDKDVVVQNACSFMGCQTYPAYIPKGRNV
jgi:glucose-1-phosphate adenylyltransferase